MTIQRHLCTTTNTPPITFLKTQWDSIEYPQLLVLCMRELLLERCPYLKMYYIPLERSSTIQKDISEWSPQWNLRRGLRRGPGEPWGSSCPDSPPPPGPGPGGTCVEEVRGRREGWSLVLITGFERRWTVPSCELPMSPRWTASELQNGAEENATPQKQVYPE